MCDNTDQSNEAQAQCLSPEDSKGVNTALEAPTYLNQLRREKRYLEESLSQVDKKLKLLEGNPYLQEMANQLFRN
jgi:hypothetical protein